MSKFRSKTGEFQDDRGRVHPTISIYEFDEEGFQKYKKATICIGVKKAKALLECVEDLKKFVEANMSAEELAAFAEQLLVGEENGNS